MFYSSTYINVRLIRVYRVRIFNAEKGYVFDWKRKINEYQVRSIFVFKSELLYSSL